MEGDSYKSGMMGFMPFYLPVAHFMAPPYVTSPPDHPASVSEGSPESVPERVSETLSQKDYGARQLFSQIYETGQTWYPYEEGLWLRAVSLRLLDDGRRERYPNSACSFSQTSPIRRTATFRWTPVITEWSQWTTSS